MRNLYVFSGPCGCGKTTLAKAFAQSLVDGGGARQVYLIHGDDFHAGFVEADRGGRAYYDDAEPSGAFLPWQDILEFNWDCILTVARKAMDRGLDVVIDYVVETELPLVRQLVDDCRANVYYLVLTASEESIRRRIAARGDVELTERALFLKKELDAAPDNRGHLFDNTDIPAGDEIKRLNIEAFLLP